MSRQQDPWQGLATTRDRWAYRVSLIIIAVWSVTVSVGAVRYIISLFE